EIVGGNIFALDDPELLKYPIAYFSEPGGWSPNDKEVAGFRNYFLKGGFAIFDDFGEMRGFDQGDWLNTVTQMQRVLPGYQLVRLEASHPIFHAFYDISLDVISRTYRCATTKSQARRPRSRAPSQERARRDHHGAAQAHRWPAGRDRARAALAVHGRQQSHRRRPRAREDAPHSHDGAGPRSQIFANSV